MSSETLPRRASLLREEEPLCASHSPSRSEVQSWKSSGLPHTRREAKPHSGGTREVSARQAPAVRKRSRLFHRSVDYGTTSSRYLRALAGDTPGQHQVIVTESQVPDELVAIPEVSKKDVLFRSGERIHRDEDEREIESEVVPHAMTIGPCISVVDVAEEEGAQSARSSWLSSSTSGGDDFAHLCDFDAHQKLSIALDTFKPNANSKDPRYLRHSCAAPERSVNHDDEETPQSSGATPKESRPQRHSCAAPEIQAMIATDPTRFTPSPNGRPMNSPGGVRQLNFVRPRQRNTSGGSSSAGASRDVSPTSKSRTTSSSEQRQRDSDQANDDAEKLHVHSGESTMRSLWSLLSPRKKSAPFSSSPRTKEKPPSITPKFSPRSPQREMKLAGDEEPDPSVGKMDPTIFSGDKLPQFSDLMWKPVLGDSPAVTLTNGEERKGFRYLLVGASIESLLKVMIFNSPSNDFMELVLLTHSEFISSKKLMEFLFQSYLTGREAKDVHSQLRVVNVIRHWFKFNIFDFHNGSKANLVVEMLLEKMKKGPDREPKMAELLLADWRNAYKVHRTEEEERLQKALSRAEQPYLPKDMTPTPSRFHPMEIARQLTLAMSDVLRQVPPREMLQKHFEKQTKSPKFHEMVALFNKVTGWISAEVFAATSHKSRSKIITHFVSVCQKLHLVQNYAGVLAIVSALTHFTIMRLQDAWTLVSSKAKERWSQLIEICNPTGNFRNLREIAEKARPPSLPPLALIFKDLVFITDGNPQWRDDAKKMLNVEKMGLLAAAVKRMRRLQTTYYPFVRLDPFHAYFDYATLVLEEKSVSMIGQSAAL